MAEGHAVARWAREVRRLIGQPLLSVELPKTLEHFRPQLLERQITAVESHGKHLLIRLTEDLTIHCHGLMFGSWQFGSPPLKLRKPAARVRLGLRTATREAVFFNGPVMEILTSEQVAKHPRLRLLGPDILSRDFDRDEAWKRLSRRPDIELGDAVLRQEIVAGIGNIFKSEGLFQARLNPRRRIEGLARHDAERLWNVVRPIMEAASRRAGPIVTLPAHLRRGRIRNWVYRRRGLPCFICAAKIEMLRQGALERTTYFCPKCQA